MKIRAHLGHIARGKEFLPCTHSTLTLLIHHPQCHTLHMATIPPTAWHHQLLQPFHPMVCQRHQPLQPLHHMLRACLCSLHLALPCHMKFCYPTFVQSIDSLRRHKRSWRHLTILQGTSSWSCCWRLIGKRLVSLSLHPIHF